jgi:hypothetical protein
MTRLVKIGGQKILENLRILQNVIEKSFINWQDLSLVKINTRISETPCIFVLQKQLETCCLFFFLL